MQDVPLTGSSARGWGWLANCPCHSPWSALPSISPSLIDPPTPTDGRAALPTAHGPYPWPDPPPTGLSTPIRGRSGQIPLCTNS